MCRYIVTLAVGLSLILPTVSAQQKTDTRSNADNDLNPVPEFISLDVPGGQATWISPDGSAVIGTFGAGGGGWVWTTETGAVMLPSSANVVALAGNDFPAAGSALNPDQDGRTEAATWNAIDASPELLGGLPDGQPCDGTLSTSYGMNADASVVVGLAYGKDCGVAHAFQWTESSGMTALPKLTQDRAARANGVSADGNIIWGWNDTETGFRRAVRWVDGAIEELHDAEGNPIGEATGAGRDAGVIVGSGLGIAGQGNHAYRWTTETGAVSIGDLTASPTESNFAFGTNDDGTIIGGATGFGPFRQATIWTEEADSLVWLTDFLADREITVPEGWDLNTVTAISTDGRFIAGWGSDGTNLNSFLIDLGSDVPENDDVADAIVLTESGTYEGSNVNATLEDDEPEPSCTWGDWTTNFSVWWSFTATGDGTATIDTNGSLTPEEGNLDTILSLHDASDLSEVACDDDGGEELWSLIEEAPVTEGETYLIRVAGYNESTVNQGTIQLTTDFQFGVADEATPEEIAEGLSLPSPNPASGTSTFTVAVESGQDVTVEVFDVTGRRVQTLYDGALTAGMSETLTLDASALPAGVYVVRATGENFAKTRRVTIVR